MTDETFTVDTQLWQRVYMASTFTTQLEVLTIMFSLLVFALFTLTGMLSEECAHSNGMTANTHAPT